MSDLENFIITENAAKRIFFLASEKQKNGLKLRITVEGGGCSGFQYKYDLTDKVNDDDELFEMLEAHVVIDKMSLNFLLGSKLDYVENLGGEYFEIKNPNATSGCGCGKSFSV